MKVGVKTYDDENFLDYFRNKCDFFEVQAIVGNDYEFLKKFKGKEFVVHAEHQEFGVNNADSGLRAKNLKSINFARGLADDVRAKKIVMHAGKLLNDKCSFENAVKSVKGVEDKRVIIENLPDSKKDLCTTPDKMKEFLKLTGKGFCLDFNHAISYARQVEEDEFKLIKSFLKLKPKHFHLGGQTVWKFLGFRRNVDHLSLIDGNIDLKRIVKLIPSNVTVTLETVPDIVKTNDDLSILRTLVEGKKSSQR